MAIQGKTIMGVVLLKDKCEAERESTVQEKVVQPVMTYKAETWFMHKS